MLTIYHAYALLVLAGRFTPQEAQAGAAMFDENRDVSSVRDAVSELVGTIAAATGRMRVNCPRCEGRGFYRGHKLAENEAIVVFCDDCEGHGTLLAELDT
jgi:DnaJ-class molecular chaperone